MGRKKLFLGPAELIEGYGLNGHKYKSRRIYLIGSLSHPGVCHLSSTDGTMGSVSECQQGRCLNLSTLPWQNEPTRKRYDFFRSSAT